MAISFNLSSAVLEWARVSMGYTIEEAAKKAGVTSERFESWEKGEKTPTYKQLETLAEKVYKRPLVILLLQHPPKEVPVQNDFRNLSNSEIENLSPEARLVLRKAKRYQLILEEVAPFDSVSKFKDFKVSLSDDVITTSKEFRKFLNLSLEEQKIWPAEKAFQNFKKIVESVGVYIFQFKMPINEARAFCLTGDYPIIVLNTEDSTNGRIFSLFHELCHILFNINGVFRDIETGKLNREYSHIERFCNQFAASFLVPDEDFKREVRYLISTDNWFDYSILSLAKLYNVSNEVIARKLLSEKLITETYFWTKKRGWDAIANSAKEKAKAKLREQDVKGIAQDIKIISEKGTPYVSNVISAYQQGIISSSDLSNYLETKLDHLPKLIKRIGS